MSFIWNVLVENDSGIFNVIQLVFCWLEVMFEAKFLICVHARSANNQ